MKQTTSKSITSNDKHLSSHHSVGQELTSGLAEQLWFSISQEVPAKLLAKVAIASKFHLGYKIHSWTHSGGCWVVSVLHGLLNWGPQSLPRGFWQACRSVLKLWQIGRFPQSQVEREIWERIHEGSHRHFNELILKVSFYHFYHIFIRSKSVILAHSKGEEITQGMNTRRQNLWLQS